MAPWQLSSGALPILAPPQGCFLFTPQVGACVPLFNCDSASAPTSLEATRRPGWAQSPPEAPHLLLKDTSLHCHSIARSCGAFLFPYFSLHPRGAPSQLVLEPRPFLLNCKPKPGQPSSLWITRIGRNIHVWTSKKPSCNVRPESLAL